MGPTGGNFSGVMEILYNVTVMYTFVTHQTVYLSGYVLF